MTPELTVALDELENMVKRLGAAGRDPLMAGVVEGTQAKVAQAAATATNRLAGSVEMLEARLRTLKFREERKGGAE